MTYSYCTFKADAEHVCRYTTGIKVSEPGWSAEHVLLSDPGYQEWLKANPAGAPLVDTLADNPWAVPSAAPPTAAEKLAAAGLTVEELKALLAS